MRSRASGGGTAGGRALARAAAAVIAGLLAGALPGCASDDGPYFGTSRRVGKDAATIYVNNGNEPEYLDPAKSNDTASSALINQMFEGLTAYAPGDVHATQGVASRWDKSDDNRIFRFHLRPEARWSDGKPVTAHDFEYSWKRALRPATASVAATNLYALKNGELFNLGKLKALRADVTARLGPRPDAPPGPALAKGDYVAVLGRSPAKVATRIAPLAAIPPGHVSHSKEDPKARAPEQLAVGGGAPIAAAPDGGLWDAEVDVLQAGPEVECNGAADRWFEVARGDRRGFLPGCLLTPAKRADAYALVAAHRSLPTYVPARTNVVPPEDSGAPLGFVLEADLVEDDRAVGVRAVDDLTLDVELARPTPYFTDVTSVATLLPVRRDVIEAFEARGEPDLWTRPESIVVNGPYTLDEWKFRYEITMKRNPAYWARDKLKIHRIVWLQIEQSHPAMSLYKAGDLDYTGDNTSLPPEYLERLSTKKDFHRSEYLSTYWYEFNTKVPPVNDARVRRALNMAIDKRQIVEKITRGGQRTATHYVPDFTGSGYADQVAEDARRGADPFAAPEVMFDPERARALLKEAGYDVARDGDGYRATGFPPLEILYNTHEGHKHIAVAVQDMWKRHLGISVTLRNEEWKVMLKNVRDGHYQVVRFGWVAEYNHPHTWLGTFLSSSPQNRTGWADKEFDELVGRAAATSDLAESIRIYRKAEARAVEGMAKLPFYFYTKSTLVKPWVRGFKPNARNLQLMKWLWIDAVASSADGPGEPASPTLEFPPPGRIAPPAEPAP